MRQLKITQQITQRTDASISRYFQDINKYEMISAEEEAELTIRIRNGDGIALEKLVVANLRFVVSVAKQYTNQGLSFPDLINEGNVGLVKAAQRFDETRGFKFISYAVWWIRQSILTAVSEQIRLVRLPLNRVASINKITKAISLLEQDLEREPSDEEIGLLINISTENVRIANSNKMHHISLDKPLSNSETSDFCLNDLIQAANSSAPDNDLLLESDNININRALKNLNQRESTVLIMSYGLFKSHEHSLEEIGYVLRLTSERVRQIRNHALIKLKKMLNGKCAFEM